MRWILALLICLSPLAPARADGPNDQFVDIYTLIQQADSLNQSGQIPAAADKYQKALNGLKTLQGGFPSWNKDVVQFRLDYVAEKLNTISKAIPAPPPVIKRVYSNAQLEQQVTDLENQVQTLSGENASLDKKLKEALSIQPASVDPQELAKAEARITALQKDRDLLNVSLEQEKAARQKAEKGKKGASESDLAGLRAKAGKADDLAKENDGLRHKLTDASKEISILQARQTESSKTSAAELAALRTKAAKADDLAQERDALNLKLAIANKELSSLQARPVEPSKSNDAELAGLKKDRAATEKKLEETQQELAALKKSKSHASETKASDAAERNELKKKLAAVTQDLATTQASGEERVLAARTDLAKYKNAAAERDALAIKLKSTEDELAAAKKTRPAAVKNPPAQIPDESSLKIAQLQARLATLEANPVPYTAEELVVIKKPSITITSPPPVAPKSTRPVHSSKDLPPGAGALMADAQRAFLTRDYEKAESKYREVLRQDDRNVYVLAHLANAQFANGEIDECEKTVRDVIALDPNDPAGLYLMGNLRMRQGKLDEALDALSRSAQINPTNSVTQNSLGTVLSQKGQRKAAETALRKALMSDPDYADAHHNLAIVYATENPPAMGLARLHYKKAVELGHPKDSDLEKLIEEKK